MRSVLNLLIFITFSLLSIDFSHAICMQTGNTPSGGNVINCPGPIQIGPLNLGSSPSTTNLADDVSIPAGGGIDASGSGVSAIITGNGDDILQTSGDITSGFEENAITMLAGNDLLIIDGGTINASPGTPGNGQCVFTSGGEDTIIMNDGVCNAGDNGLFSSGDDDRIIMNGGMINAFNNGLFGSGGNDYIEVNGGTINTTNLYIIFGSTGNDEVVLNGGTFMPGDGLFATLGSGDDTLTFNANLDLDGLIECNEGFDTLVFAMEVPIELINQISGQIALADPAGDTLVIDGLFYEWTDCELLVNELVPVRVTRPIPTLSQWGLIAMAGVIGLTGIYFASRKKRLTD